MAGTQSILPVLGLRVCQAAHSHTCGYSKIKFPRRSHAQKTSHSTRQHQHRRHHPHRRRCCCPLLLRLLLLAVTAAAHPPPHHLHPPGTLLSPSILHNRFLLLKWLPATAAPPPIVHSRDSPIDIQLGSEPDGLIRSSTRAERADWTRR